MTASPRFRNALVLALGVVGCAGAHSSAPAEDGSWSFVARSASAAFLSVNGTSASDVWLSGADDGTGPVVLHFDGRTWERRETGVDADLWWVNALAGGSVFFGGSNATVLRYDGAAFAALDTPGPTAATVFGVWAAAEDDVYAVGSTGGKSGFVWHYDGSGFGAVPLDDVLPLDEHGDTPGLFKVWGSSASDVWVVGAKGVVLRGSATDGFHLVQAGGTDTLFTVNARDERVVMVGGGSSGVILALEDGTLVDETPAAAPLLQGVSIAADGSVWAAGYAGSLYHGRSGVFSPVDPGLDFTASESLHSIWTDPDGGVWAAGGNVLTPTLDDGLALHFGAAVPTSDPF